MSIDLASLHALVGERGVLTEDADKAPYQFAARFGVGRACAVVLPATTTQVSAVVAWCAERRIQVVPQGANTGLVAGAAVDGSGQGLILSLDRLRRPLQVDVVDRTVRVGAGVRLSALNAALAPDGLFLPVDLAADPSIGGLVATNAGGARFLRYGDMRRRVLSLEMVLPDVAGTIVELGRPLRKDNAALALRHLCVGASGALGVITRVDLELSALPMQRSAAVMAPRTPELAPQILLLFERLAGEYLAAFEGMSQAALDCALEHVPRLRSPFAGASTPDYTILVEFTRGWAPRPHEARLDDVLQDCLAEAWEQGLLTDAVVGPPERFWALRHGLSEGLRAAGTVIGFDLSFRRSQALLFRRRAMDALARAFPEVEVCDFGHIADGGVHFNLLSRGPGLDPQRLAGIRALVLQIAVEEFGGSFSGEHGLGRANQGAYDAFTPAPVKALSGAVQRAFGAAPTGVSSLDA